MCYWSILDKRLRKDNALDVPLKVIVKSVLKTPRYNAESLKYSSTVVSAFIHQYYIKMQINFKIWSSGSYFFYNRHTYMQCQFSKFIKRLEYIVMNSYLEVKSVTVVKKDLLIHVSYERYRRNRDNFIIILKFHVGKWYGTHAVLKLIDISAPYWLK